MLFRNFKQIFLIKDIEIIATILERTMLAPVGTLNKNEKTIPNKKQTKDIKPEKITKDLKLFAHFLAITAGKIIRLEINKVPIILIPTTIIRDVIKETNK